MSESYKIQMSDKGKREPDEEEMASKEREISSEVDKSKEMPSQNEPKKSPAEEEKSGEVVGDQPQSQAEEILSEPILIPRNPLALISRIVLLVFMIDVGTALVLVTIASFPGLTGKLLFAMAALAMIVKTGILIALILRASTSWTSQSYYLTERQLIHRTGIANIDEKVYELDNIRHVHLIQDALGRQFDFGHLELLVATAGLTETIRLSDLKNPEHFKNIFTNYLG